MDTKNTKNPKKQFDKQGNKKCLKGEEQARNGAEGKWQQSDFSRIGNSFSTSLLKKFYSNSNKRMDVLEILENTTIVPDSFFKNRWTP